MARTTTTPVADGDKRATPPLMLMPMRLEYRLVTAQDKLLVLRPHPKAAELTALRAKLSQTDPADEKRVAVLTERIASLSARIGEASPVFDQAKLDADRELWFRWYPDDNFAQSGIAPVSDDERTALDAVLDHPRARDWPKLGDPGFAAAWSELVAMTGLPRAVHLMRSGGKGGDPAWESRIGRIPALPDSIAVFAFTDGKIHPLGRGAAIPPNAKWGTGPVSYSPAALGVASWVSDFDTAVAQGMGLKLRDPQAIRQALDANWLVCTGLGEEAGPMAVADWVADRVAAGGLGYLKQDTPTNNTSDVLAGPGADPQGTAQEALSPLVQWELGISRKNGLDAALLAEALGLDEKTAMQPGGADSAGHAEAAAMIRVIGPALMDGALAATSTMQDVTDSAFIELLARHVQVRGLLPGLKIGGGAYGVQPVTDTFIHPKGNYKLTQTESAYEDFIRGYSEVVKALMLRASDGVTLRVEPDDPDAAEKLTDILQTSRVSRRLDVSEEGEPLIRALGCPYVEGSDAAYKPAAYLRKLDEVPLVDLPEPDESDTKWPLLYRLAHLSALRNRVIEVLKGSPGFTGRGNLRQVQGNWQAGLSARQRAAVSASLRLSVAGFSRAPGQALNSIPSDRLPVLRILNTRFAEALATLRGVATRPDGTAELETLLMEVVDLFQHRLEAWMTGLASIRLEHLRREHPDAGLALGWYGMLGQLRETSATGASDGYLQAPSQGQAVTAAIMRAAHLRNRSEGAFEIDLSAARTRSALKLMDHIRHGVPLPEALGLRGERYLRDSRRTPVIFELRKAFPLENDDADGKGTRGPVGKRCFDGLALVEGTTALPADQQDVRTYLADALDALSDLVMAEAVHARAGGSADVAAAWLRVLSGGPIPHRPEFLRTRRSGHASDYRVTLVLPQQAPPTQGTPLATAEYGLAAMIAGAVPGLADAQAVARLVRDSTPLHTVEVVLSKHLGLDPIHIARLGVAALTRRIENHAIADYHAQMRVETLYASGWIPDRDGLTTAGIVVEVDFGDAEGAVRQAAGLWRMAHAGQALSPGDLSNAAAPSTPLDEEQHIAALQGAADDMWLRAERLEAALRAERNQFVPVCKRLITRIAEHYEKPGVAWGAHRGNDQMLHTRVSRLHQLLAALERWAVEGTSIRPASERLVADMVGWETTFRQIMTAVDDRLARLSKALHGRDGVAETLAEARADLNAAIATVRLATVDGLALFPVYSKSPPLSPLLHPGQAAKDALGPWPKYRARLDGLLEDVGQSHSGFAVRPEATADDAGAALPDTRDEALAPRAYHRGIFLATSADMVAATISGVVVDEWVEKRPSAQQDAAIALNYDSPQAEAPNTLVLAVPEDPYAPGWDATRAAAMVGELIDLMRIRALTTQTTPLSDTILPLSNLVAHVGSHANERPRIPAAKFKQELRDWFAAAGTRRVVSEADLSRLGGGWNQTNRFGRMRRRNQ